MFDNSNSIKMDTSNGSIGESFVETVRRHKNVDYRMGKWDSRLYDNEGQRMDPSNKIHYYVAEPPQTSIIEEKDERERPMNFAQRLGGHANRSFEPSYASEAEESVLNKSHKFADDFPLAPFQMDDGLREYNPDYEKEFLDARDWISDNMSRGALPSEMVGEEELAKNIAENSFNDSILSIHDISRDDFKVNPREWNFANLPARTSGNRSLPVSDQTLDDLMNPVTGQPMWFNPMGRDNSLNSTGNSTLNSSLNSTSDSQRRSSWEKNKREIIQRLYMGDGEEPTLSNRTFPVPSKNVKGLYKPWSKKDTSGNKDTSTNLDKSTNLDTTRSPSLDFGDISKVSHSSPYTNRAPLPRTSTPIKSRPGQNKSVPPMSISSNTANSSSLSGVNRSSLFGKFESGDYSRLNKAVKTDLSSSINSSTNKSKDGDSKDRVSHLPDPEVSEQATNPHEESVLKDSALEQTQHDATSNPSVKVPQNSQHGSPNTSTEYQLNSNELLTELSESLPAENKGKEAAATKLNMSVGDKPREKVVQRKPIVNKGSFVPYGSPQVPSSDQSKTMTLTDSGLGVSLQINGCDLKIVTESDLPPPPCCKKSEEKLKYVAAINAKKVRNLSKTLQLKTGEFQIMLVENLKLARKNFEMKSILQTSNIGYIRERNAANSIEAKHQALQQKFDLLQNKLERLELKNKGMEHGYQETEQIINTLTRNYDKMMELSEKQGEEITELNEQLEELDAANKDMKNTLKQMGIFMETHELEQSQNDSTFSVMSEDNSILKKQCASYQAHVDGLENSVKLLDSKIQDLSALNESLSLRNRSLTAEVSQLEHTAEIPNKSVDTSLDNTQSKKLDEGLIKIVDFYQKVSDDLQTKVQQKDKRISELESSMNDTVLGSSSSNDKIMFHSFNQSTLENSAHEKTADQQTLNEFQQKLTSAREEVKGLKSLLRDAKGVMKDLAINPAKSASPDVVTTLDDIYQELQKAEDGISDDLQPREANATLENSQLEKTTDQDVINQMGQKIAAARTEVKGLKTLLHHAKIVMKELSEDPTKSSDPRVLGAFDAVYKQFKKVSKKN